MPGALGSGVSGLGNANPMGALCLLGVSVAGDRIGQLITLMFRMVGQGCCETLFEIAS